jgi:putative oxidoreductase
MTNSTLPAYGTAILRMTLGALLVAHAALKIVVFTLPGTVGFFEKVGFPGWLAYPTVTIELVAGLALVLGVYSRIAAIAALPVLLGASVVHAGNGWLFSNPNGGWEFPLFWAIALVAQALLGDGAFALRPQPNYPLKQA